MEIPEHSISPHLVLTRILLGVAAATPVAQWRKIRDLAMRFDSNPESHFIIFQ
jgi:hypothetical protein